MKRPTVFWIPKPYDLVNQRPPHLKFRGFPTLMASRFSKGADLIPHYPLLTFNLWPTHNLSPQTLAFKRIPKVDLLRSKLDHLLPYVIITKSHRIHICMYNSYNGPSSKNILMMTFYLVSGNRNNEYFGFSVYWKS